MANTQINDLFIKIAGLCGKNKRAEASVIIGILQAVRDNCPIDYTVQIEMLNLVKKQTKECVEKDTQLFTKLYSNIYLN